MQPDLQLPAQVMALFAQPRHGGRPSSGRFRHGVGGSVKTGSLLELWLATQDGAVKQARFEAFGCPSTVACGEWLCDWLPGRPLADAARLTGLELAQTLALPAAKRGVALVAEDALRATLQAPAENMADDREDTSDGA